MIDQEKELLKTKIERLEREIQRLMACQLAFEEWDKLSRAGDGKYNGPSVLRARDRLSAALIECQIKEEEK